MFYTHLTILYPTLHLLLVGKWCWSVVVVVEQSGFLVVSVWAIELLFTFTSPIPRAL